MKLDVVKIGASLIVILALLMCSSLATETAWRHSGFELWGYDINFTDHNASNIYLLDADYLHGDCSNVTNLNASNITSGEIPLAQIPNTLTGKDADTVDGYHASSLISGCNISNGTYLGNDAQNRAIAHGMSTIVLYVIITEDGGNNRVFHLIEGGKLMLLNGATVITSTVTAADSTNFYVGLTANPTNTANAAINYHWVAFS